MHTTLLNNTNNVSLTQQQKIGIITAQHTYNNNKKKTVATHKNRSRTNETKQQCAQHARQAQNVTESLLFATRVLSITIA